MDITLKQAAILAAVSRKPGVSQGELFASVPGAGSQKVVFHQAIDRLVKRDFLRKDKRKNGVAVNVLALTADGKTALKAAIEFASFILL